MSSITATELCDDMFICPYIHSFNRLQSSKSTSSVSICHCDLGSLGSPVQSRGYLVNKEKHPKQRRQVLFSSFISISDSTWTESPSCIPQNSVQYNSNNSYLYNWCSSVLALPPVSATNMNPGLRQLGPSRVNVTLYV